MQEVAGKIGRAVAQLHDGGIVHGDLTTSNMITRDGDGVLVRTDGARALLRLSRLTAAHWAVLFPGANRLWAVLQHDARGGQGC